MCVGSGFSFAVKRVFTAVRTACHSMLKSYACSIIIITVHTLYIYRHICTCIYVEIGHPTCHPSRCYTIDSKFCPHTYCMCVCVCVYRLLDTFYETEDTWLRSNTLNRLIVLNSYTTVDQTELNTSYSCWIAIIYICTKVLKIKGQSLKGLYPMDSLFTPRKFSSSRPGSFEFATYSIFFLYILTWQQDSLAQVSCSIFGIWHARQEQGVCHTKAI